MHACLVQGTKNSETLSLRRLLIFTKTNQSISKDGLWKGKGPAFYQFLTPKALGWFRLICPRAKRL